MNASKLVKTVLTAGLNVYVDRHDNRAVNGIVQALITATIPGGLGWIVGAVADHFLK